MPPPDAAALISQVAREQMRRLVGAVLPIVRDPERAEDLVQDTLTHALEHWGRVGPPDNPGAWLTTAAKHRALDAIKHQRHVEAHQTTAAAESPRVGLWVMDVEDPDEVADEQLRLIFMCCHPALSKDSQIALTLRWVGGLSTEEIARAFLVPEPTMAQRLVRAKKTLREVRVDFVLPGEKERRARLDAVLHVLYLVFTAGHTAPSGPTLQRVDLTREAMRLSTLLTGLVPHEPEPWGLLALMSFHAARERTRVDAQGRVVLLEAQDRSQWDATLITLGAAHLRRAVSLGGGPYSLQAAIAGVHASAPSFAQTDWAEIVGYYDALRALAPSPFVDLNRAIAVSYLDGPKRGLELCAPLAERLDAYPYFHATRGELLRRTGALAEARMAFERALGLTTNEAEREFLLERLRT